MQDRGRRPPAGRKQDPVSAPKGESVMKVAFSDRALNVRKDTLDFRDLMYIPTLVEVPAYRALQDYRRAQVPVLDQGKDGACTGFGLATVAHYLLRTHKVTRDAALISPFMFYDLARRYDEWPGENYEGSSCRGAMKGWYKHGVCRETLWPMSRPGAPLGEVRAEDAARRPLGAYFRVNHQSLVAMHSAITEAGVLYASASVHGGWQNGGKAGLLKKSDKILRGAAVAPPAVPRGGFLDPKFLAGRPGEKRFSPRCSRDLLGKELS